MMKGVAPRTGALENFWMEDGVGWRELFGKGCVR